MSDRNGKWYQAGLHFGCTQCGNCCGGFPGYVWVTNQEAEAIAAFLKMPTGEFIKKYTTRAGRRMTLIEKDNYDCIFLDRKGEKVGCEIYSVRPQQCRTWPFRKRNITDADSWNEQGRRCGGINRGRAYTPEEIDETAKNSPC